ncbi:MAG: hypothetical protein JWL81_2864 [Verrucomicrobiales bacterium]|nr:hypothetical protein [Verrucomicrobiales bacterium]
MEGRPLFYSVVRWVVLMWICGGPGRADVVASPLYDKDPGHLWNRLHAALTMRAPEGKVQPPDLLDPQSREVFLSGPVNTETVALLREFLKSNSKALGMSDLQHAVMQWDLLAIFHLMVASDGLSEPRNPDKGWAVPERELVGALAQAIRHVALSAEAIRKLPDNYSTAAHARDVATAYDHEKPGPFLPKDLLAENGPWIALGTTEGTNGSVASFHFGMFRGRSSFEVLMRHPEGRAAGQVYLKELASLPKPWVMEKPADLDPLLDRPSAPWPNPATPQFPVGTMWALVRRSILVDSAGHPFVSPIVESVQIRVYRALSRKDALDSPEFQAQRKIIEQEKREEDFDDLLAQRYQTAFEWEMQRSLLLGGGGFHLTQPEDLRYSRFMPSEPRPVASFCVQCHAAPGIHSVNSRSRLFGVQLARPPEFFSTTREALDRNTLYASRQLPGWALLEWLWDK